MNSGLNDIQVKWQLWIPGSLCAREKKMGRNWAIKTIWVDFIKKRASFKAATLIKTTFS